MGEFLSSNALPQPASEYYSNIADRKTESQLLKEYLMSKLELRLATQLRVSGVWVTTPMRLITPDEDNPEHFTERYIDLYLPKKDLAVEVDGGVFHTTEKQKKRDAKKNNAIVQTGIVRILRLPFSIPDELIYGNKPKAKRDFVERRYKEFEKKWIKAAAEKILEYSDIEEKDLNHSPLLY